MFGRPSNSQFGDTDRRPDRSSDRGSELAGVRIDGIEDLLELAATLSA
jgi:hypothetical protein